MVSLGAGYCDFNRRKDTAADFRLEYRHGEKLWLFKPWAGLELTADGAVYGLAGLLVDVYFGRRLVVTPSFGAGLYHNGNGKDLGNQVEFRSQVELAWRFNDQSRLSIAISHISNAGIANRNPGAELLNVYYSIPFQGRVLNIALAVFAKIFSGAAVHDMCRKIHWQSLPPAP